MEKIIQLFQGEQLLEFMVTSSVLIACIILIRRILKGKISMRIQYALWLLVVIRLFIPFPQWIVGDKLDSSWSVMNVVEKNGLHNAKSGLDDFTTNGQNTTYNVSESEAKAGNDAETGQKGEGKPIGGAESVMTADSENPDVTSDKSSDTAVQNNRTAKEAKALPVCLLTLWLAGSVIVGCWTYLVNRKYAAYLCKHREVWGLEKERRKEPLFYVEYGTDKLRLPIYTVENLTSPCLFRIRGMLGIYLPKNFMEDKEKVLHVLAHELCHYEHRDYVWSGLRCVFLSIYWFHPFVWAAAFLSKRDCELACDEAAIELLGEKQRINYGKTLIAMAEKASGASELACVASMMSESKKGMKERVHMIANKPKMVITTIIVLGVLILGVVAFTFTSSKNKEQDKLIAGDTEDLEAKLTEKEEELAKQQEAMKDLEAELNKKKAELEKQQEELQKQMDMMVNQTGKVPMKVYYGDSNAEFVVSKTVYVPEITEEQVVSALIQASILPEDAKVLNLKIGEEGVNSESKSLQVDFNKAVATAMNATGTSGEEIMIRSIVNTFLSAYGASTVKFTVEGKPLESGHAVYDEYMTFQDAAAPSEYPVEVMLEGMKEEINFLKTYCDLGFAIGYDYTSFSYNYEPGSEKASFDFNRNGENNAEFANMTIMRHADDKNTVFDRILKEKPSAEVSLNKIKIGKNGEDAQTINYTESLVDGTRTACIYVVEHGGVVYTIDVGAMDRYQEGMTPRLQAMLHEFYFVD